MLPELVAVWLVNAAWQVSALALAARAAAAALRGVSARIVHLIWVMALLASLLVPLVSVGRTMQHREVQDSPASMAWLRMGGDVQPAPAVEKHVPVTFTPAVLWTLSGVYGLVLAALTWCFAGRWRDARDLRRHTSAVADSAVLEAATLACQRHFRREVPTLRSSRRAPSPLTMGWRHPVIVLPAGLVGHLSDEQARSVIAHEMAHVLRRDYACNLVYEVLSLALAWHPAVAYIRRQIHLTRELACDERVVCALVSPAVYARSLIAVTRLGLASGAPGLAIGTSGDHTLDQRVRRLFTYEPSSTAAGRLIFAMSAVWLLAASLLVTSWPIDVAARTREVSSHARASGELGSPFRIVPDERLASALEPVASPSPSPMRGPAAGHRPAAPPGRPSPSVERKESEPDRKVNLARRYGVDETEIDSLRAQGLGWGEVRIALAIADRAKVPVSEVTSRRGSPEGGWGAIARGYGITVGEALRAGGGPPFGRGRGGPEPARPGAMDEP